MEVFMAFPTPQEIGKTYHNRPICRPPLNGQPETIYMVSFKVVREVTWQDWANQIQEETGEPVPDWMLHRARMTCGFYAVQLD